MWLMVQFARFSIVTDLVSNLYRWLLKFQEVINKDKVGEFCESDIVSLAIVDRRYTLQVPFKFYHMARSSDVADNIGTGYFCKIWSLILPEIKLNYEFFATIWTGSQFTVRTNRMTFPGVNVPDCLLWKDVVQDICAVIIAYPDIERLHTITIIRI